jgi:hypothetical protein
MIFKGKRIGWEVEWGRGQGQVKGQGQVRSGQVRSGQVRLSKVLFYMFKHFLTFQLSSSLFDFLHHNHSIGQGKFFYYFKKII